MRHLRWFAVVAIVFFSFTSPAAAQGLGREWLEKLSGPGPFTGFNYRFELGDVRDPIRSLKLKLETDAKEKASATTEAERKAIDEKPLCAVCLEFELGEFANYGDVRPEQGKITFSSSQAYIMVPITKRGVFEVGGGLGWVHFQGETFAFNKLTVPVQAIFKPLRLPIFCVGRRKAGIVQVVLPVLMFPFAIRQEEFTKRAFSFEPEHFVVPERRITVMVDFSSLIYGR